MAKGQHPGKPQPETPSSSAEGHSQCSRSASSLGRSWGAESLWQKGKACLWGPSGFYRVRTTTQ